MSLSPQNGQMLSLLRSGPVHSHDLRAVHSIGDPAKRACELREAGYPVRSKLARRNGRHGVTYFLEDTAGIGGVANGQPPRGASSPAPAPEPSGTDHAERPVWLLHEDSDYDAAPVPGCVQVLDANPMSPLCGRSYWRAPEGRAAA